jgi:4a-hydroxytetrahydrobiopterin dehydratase
MSLAQEKCIPCVKGEGKLAVREVEQLLATLPNWVVEGSKLITRINFKNFVEALAYVNRLGALAEEQGHHPDISFGWGYAEIALTTHDAGGITRNDFIMAAKVDTLS